MPDASGRTTKMVRDLFDVLKRHKATEAEGATALTLALVSAAIFNGTTLDGTIEIIRRAWVMLDGTPTPRPDRPAAPTGLH